MPNTYNIGNSQGPITLAVAIDTIGLAATRVIVLDLNGTDPGTPVAHSVDATGDIAQQVIGNYTLLKGLRLSSFTKVTLTGNNPDARAAEAARIGGTYTLDGGDGGTGTYNNPTATYMDPDVFLNFVVDMQ